MAANRPARSWAPILFAGAIAVAVVSTGGAALAAGGSAPQRRDVTIEARATTFTAQQADQAAPPQATASASNPGAGSTRRESTSAPVSSSAAPQPATKKTEATSAAAASGATTKQLAAATATPAATAVPIVPGTPSARVQIDDLTPVSGSAASSALPVLEREHKVQPGETLSAIAARYGVRTETLVRNNAGVTDRDMLKIGQTLRVPPSDGLLYEVRLGDSLNAIAGRYDVEPAAVLAEPVNNLSAPDMLREGQVVFLPGAKMPAPPPTPTPTPTPVPATATRTATATQAITNAATAVATAATRVATTVAAAGSGWRWPITGPISSYFGPSHPLGIDIDLYARDGQPIAASRAGVVTFAGGNPCCSYGYYVELDHGDGTTSLYAHFNQPPPVKIGQRVAQGETVGYAGTTGYSTGTHLHFEIRRAGTPLNPLSYLP